MAPRTGTEILREIRRRDPDGDENRTTPPTLADIDAFERWIAETYGLDAVRDYYIDWEPRPEV